jgi:hypothetical protein
MGVADVATKPGIDRTGVAAAHHQVDPAIGQVLQHGEVLGDLDRVIVGDQGRRGGQDDLVGLRGDVAQHRGRRGRDEGGIVVLAGGKHVESNLFGLESDLHHRLDPLRLGRGATVGRVGGHVTNTEYAELHSESPRLPND